jgi:hypothetical protein
MSLTFHTPINNVSDTVQAARSSGAPIVVSNGAQFGSTFPLIVTTARSGTVLCILNITGRSGNTLTVSGAIEGTTDQNLVVGDGVQMRPTALAITEIQSAVNGLLPTGSDGDVQFEASGSFGSDSNLHWDPTNHRLGVGTNAPAQQVHIAGSSGPVLQMVEYSGTESSSALAYGGIQFNNSDGICGYVNFTGGDYTTTGLFESGMICLQGFQPNGIFLVTRDGGSGAGDILFATGGYTSDHERMRITVGGDVTLSAPLLLATLADSAASNGSVYFGSDHSGQLCRKDSGGTVHVIG